MNVIEHFSNNADSIIDSFHKLSLSIPVECNMADMRFMKGLLYEKCIENENLGYKESKMGLHHDETLYGHKISLKTGYDVRYNIVVKNCLGDKSINHDDFEYMLVFQPQILTACKDGVKSPAFLGLLDFDTVNNNIYVCGDQLKISPMSNYWLLSCTKTYRPSRKDQTVLSKILQEHIETLMNSIIDVPEIFCEQISMF